MNSDIIEQGFQRVWQMFQETDRQFKETDRKIEETGRILKEIMKENLKGQRIGPQLGKTGRGADKTFCVRAVSETGYQRRWFGTERRKETRG